MKSFIYLSLVVLGFWNSFQIIEADHCDPKTDTQVFLPKVDDKNYHFNITEEESCAISYRSLLNPDQSPTADDGCKIRGFHLNDGTVGPSCIPEIGQLSKDELFSTNVLSQRKESGKLMSVFLKCLTFEDFKNAAMYYKSKVNSMLFSYVFSTAIVNRPDTESFSVPSLHQSQPDLFFNNRVIEEADKKLNKDEIKSLRKFEKRRTDFRRNNVNHEKTKYHHLPEEEQEEPITEREEPISERKEPITERDEPITERAEPITERAEPKRGLIIDLIAPRGIVATHERSEMTGFKMEEEEHMDIPESVSFAVPKSGKPKHKPQHSPMPIYPKPMNRRPREHEPKFFKAPQPNKIPIKRNVKLLPKIPPPEEKEEIIFQEYRTGDDQNPEHRVAYFREDIALNSHHWHWHTIYPNGWEKSLPKKDRKGELFYYMHCQMIKRYNGARIAEQLEFVKPLDIKESGIELKEGYYPHLTSKSTHTGFSGRPQFMKLRDVHKMGSVEKLIQWINEVKKAIEAGVVIDDEQKIIPLEESNGIDLLGSAVESSAYSPNQDLYGDIHNLGHVLISFVHDFGQEFNSPPSVMYTLATAVRDPVFWRWHKMVDDLLELHKFKLPPYSDKYLTWKNIQIKKIDIITDANKKQNGIFPPNTCYTFFKQRPVELGRGLDFDAKSSAVTIKVRHLDHIPFKYSLDIKSLSKKAVDGHVRIFISPKYLRGGRLATDDELRKNAIEMDRFTQKLKYGNNIIKHHSSLSTVTMDPDSYWKEMGNADVNFETSSKRTPFCGCGWPHHLLLPKGTDKGISYVLFAMVSNWSQEKKGNPKKLKECGSSLTMCGLKGKDFPDKRPMGFPLDRPIPNDSGWFNRPNMIRKDIKIYHLEEDRD